MFNVCCRVQVYFNILYDAFESMFECLVISAWMASSQRFLLLDIVVQGMVLGLPFWNVFHGDPELAVSSADFTGVRLR